MSSGNRPFDIQAMPPPAKRVKSDESTEKTQTSVVLVSPESEKEATVSSIMRKRFHTASPTEATTHKKRKQDEETTTVHSPTSSATNQKVDPHVFASAFALASLALSPQQQQAAAGAPYNSPNGVIQTREDDARGRSVDHGDYSSPREPSSPHRGGVVEGNMIPELHGAVSPATMHRRRVKFASRMSMRSIPARVPPSRVPYDRMGVPNRMILRHGPAFHHPPYPKRTTFPFGATAAAAASPPWSVPVPPPMPPHHAAPSHPHKETDWICDFCHVASFATYEEACAHESSCRLRCGAGLTERKMHEAGLREDQHQHHHHSSMAIYDHHRIEHQKLQVMESPIKYFDGCIPLAVPSADSEWLSELNCFVRQNCVEAFSATVQDLSRASKRGRIVLGQVGIRCRFCANRDNKDKAVAAVSYPTTVSGIYESVKRWQRVHQSVCQDVPQEVREKLDTLQNTSVWVPTTRQYWADSARALGMTDSHQGIRFERPPSVPENWVPANHTESSSPVDAGEDAGEEAGYIALPCDKDEIPEYVYFLMRQVESCRFTEADRFVARSKGPVGFAGFQCRHCNGHAGLGKYFPLTAKSLATNSTSQNIHAHLLKCRKCSPQVKETLVRLKTEKGKSPRLVPGWRREFFDRIWERMHGTKPQH